MLITFYPDNIIQEAKAGEGLMDVAAKAGVLIDGNCGSTGKCGRCKVRVVTGTLPAPDSEERANLTDSEIDQGFRLACRLKIDGDLGIVVPVINSAKARKGKMISMPEKYKFSPCVEKYSFRLTPASLTSQKDDLARILEALPESVLMIEPGLIAGLPELIQDSDGILTAAIIEGKIMALEKGDTSERIFGIAFDIGTTTVAGMLWDLKKGLLIDVSTRTNPQNIFGADVISRIHSVISDPENLELMKNKIRGCLNEIIHDFTEDSEGTEGDIYEITVVGNTTMSHLFLGVDPGQLARAPFVPVFCAPVQLHARDLGIDASPLARVHLLPNIAGHVGSDIVGAILASSITEKGGCRLLIDVGTNGEIALSHNGRILACSTAAGPAFEGASICHGMRASAGAIEGVEIRGDVVALDVIDDQRPAGICGSGLIDAVAQLLDAGILDNKGRMLDQAGARSGGMPETMVSRLRDGQNGREFVLDWNYSQEEGDIVITQKDIREVQLAKGAIYAGIVILLRELGASVADLEHIILAGAFGNYIKKESALRIGLFPKMPLSKIISAGNAAGAGACLALLSDDERAKALAISRKVEHVELATHADFQTEFMKAMYF